MHFQTAGEGVEGSIITNRVMTITDTEMVKKLIPKVIQLDVDSLKHLGAVKFRNDAIMKLNLMLTTLK